jgi:hypothetical protein
MEQPAQVSDRPKLIIFAVLALLVSSFLVFAVWLQTFVFYSYEPRVVEPILLLAVTSISVTGSYLVVAPNAQLSRAVAALVPIVVLAAAGLLSVTSLTLWTISLVAVAAAAVVAGAVQSLHRHGRQSRRMQIVSGVLLLGSAIVLIALANVFYVVDRIG